MDPGKHPRWSDGARYLRGRRAHAGFSLYELIVTSGIAGVVGFSAVSLTAVVQDTRLTAIVNQLMGDLHLARSESIKRQTIVTLCKSRDGTTCTTSDPWHSGWIVFADANNNHTVDPGEHIVRVQQALEEGVNLRYGETGTYHYVRYNPSGQAWPGATFTVCDARGGSKAKAVIVYWTGRPRVSTKTSEGRSLSC